MATPDGYFDGIVDGYGNYTPYGDWLSKHDPPLAVRTGTGAKLINGGKPARHSANNPSDVDSMTGDSTAPPDQQGPGAGGGGGTPPGSAPGTTPTGSDPQGLVIGLDGTAWVYTKQYDPTANGGKGAYQWIPVPLGNPADPAFSWAAAGDRVNVDPQILQTQYLQAKNALDRTKAEQLAGTQWHPDAVNPFTGKVTLKNGNNQTVEVSLDEIRAPGFAEKYPNVDLSQVQKAIQAVNQQNWLDSKVSAPGMAGYKGADQYHYFSLTPGQPPDSPGQPPPRPGDSPPATNPNPAPPPNHPGAGGSPPLPTRPGGEIPGANPGTMPGLRPGAGPIPGVIPNPMPAPGPGGRVDLTDPRQQPANPGANPPPMPTPGPGGRTGAQPAAAGTVAATAATATPLPVPLLPGMLPPQRRSA